ncbi:uncharacterized protein LOC128278667 [Anopheles cruzii]|uniref:uncharacterized protein LOC128278667 n=1 Tax=Anopheles cruzii TaxID=68878 RepID=UPI0022EC6AB1|nr:uncharacterized protein LOC128278667 [Anopheles cruzii]
MEQRADHRPPPIRPSAASARDDLETSGSSSRSRCHHHPVLGDAVMRLETIRERNSAYSEDGSEFIDLPLPPVPGRPPKPEVPPRPKFLPEAAPTAAASVRQNVMSVAASEYLCSRLRDFEEEEGDPTGDEADGVEEIILEPIVPDDLRSIESSASNTLRKSSWSVSSSTGGDQSAGARHSASDSDDSDVDGDEEDGERSSGYRDKSPFLRSVSLSPVGRRYRRQQTSSGLRRRKTPSRTSTSGPSSSAPWRRHHEHHEADESTCCDDDFTWVMRTQARLEAPKASVESDVRRSVSRTAPGTRTPSRADRGEAASVGARADASGASTPGPSGKPPRPLRETGSLDRRRHLGSSRHERDSKSRSTHSLKEKSSSSEFPKHDSMSSNLSLNSKDHHHDSGSYNNYNSSGSGSQQHQQQHHHHHHPHHRQRQSPSPGIWEPPPPPPLSHWDPHYYWGAYPHHYHHQQQQHGSREELRLIDYHRRQQQELYRYGSNSALGSSQDLSSCASGCCSRSFYPPPPPPPGAGCCSCEHRSPWSKDCQRQDTDERLRRLQTDKEALALQVKVLTEQVQTLTAKIGELERTVKEKNQLLANAEDLLQRVSVFAKTVGIQIDKQKEMLSRSSLETQKLELMSAMSELKLQQAALERENLELRTNFMTSSSGSAALMNGSLTNGGVTSAVTNALNNNSITSGLLRRPQIITNTRMVGMSACVPGTALTSSPLHHGSHGSLPQTAISPITPKTPPATYRQRVDVHYSSLPRQAFATTLSTVSTSSGSSTATDSNANPKRNVAFGKCLPSLETYLTRNTNDGDGDDGSAALEEPEESWKSPEEPLGVAKEQSAHPGTGMSSSMNALSLARALRATEETNLPHMKAASASAKELLHNQAAAERSGGGPRTIADLAYGSPYVEVHLLRANTEPPSPTVPVPPDVKHKSEPPKRVPATGQDFKAPSLFVPLPATATRPRHEPIDKLRGFSVPNLAETENANDDRTDGSLPQRSFTPQPAPSPSMSNKLKNIFGKIKRSNSGTLDDLPSGVGGGAGAEGEFKRGGVRATAGARLGWSGSAPYRKPDKAFREWDLEAVCQWFDHLGMSMYEEELRRWLTPSAAAATELLKASPVDVEKELNLRHPLHRKKIVLALTDVSGTENDDELFTSAAKLDTAWILRWLDDVGMPQYREAFTAARMDGRMLHKLTMDDLVHLQVTSCLHVASIRRGIQLMRHEKWHPESLVRRPLPPDSTVKDDVRLWSSLRVHEWLRAVDLAEYSPNLRGTGVHGALMIFEVKFTAELFADLLSIPSSKTLLRRHLATHFKDLLGRDIIQVKREAENTLGFQPLTISAKIKTPKKSQFSLKRKKSTKGLLGGEEWSDYVCPMGGSGQEHYPAGTAAASAAAAAAANAFTSNACSANTNNVTSIGMTKNPSTVPTAYPDSTTSSSTSTTTSGVGSEHASHHPPPLTNGSVPLTMMMMASTNGTANGSGSSGGGTGGGSDSPTSTRSSTTSTS